MTSGTVQFLSCGLPDHRGGQPVKPEPRRRQRYPLERPHAGAGPDRAPRTAPAQTGSVRTAGQAADLSIADASDTFRPAPRSTAHRFRALLLSEGIPKFIHACGQTEFTCVDAGIRAVHTCESPRRNRVAPLRRDGRVGRRRVARPRSSVSPGRLGRRIRGPPDRAREGAARAVPETAVPHAAHSGRRSRRLVSPYRDMRSRSPGKRSYL